MSQNTSVAIQCFIRKNDKYLMLLRNENKKLLPGILVAPGGHKEFNEGIFECAKREVFEETGIEISDIKIKAVGIGHSLSNKDYEYCNYILMANYKSGPIKSDVNDGMLSWMTYTEIKENKKLFIEIKELLPYIFNENTEVVSYIAEYDNINANIRLKFRIEK